VTERTVRIADKDGHHESKGPEYETGWSHGTNCRIDDLDAIAEMDFLDDGIGLDRIEMGATIGVAMEAGLAKFGDAKGANRAARFTSADDRVPVWLRLEPLAPHNTVFTVSNEELDRVHDFVD
jgi:aldehyde:ferredoxin oxidoreductase